MASRLTRIRKPQADPVPESQSRAKWTASLTKTLADLMVDQTRLGNKSNKSFSKKGWKFICDNFRIQTGLWWENDQLKSRYSTLRKLYIVVTMLLGNHEFKLDETTGNITATEEAWDRYIKEHPDAEPIRSAGCPIYSQLQTIFAEPGPGTVVEHNGSAKDNEGVPVSFLSPQNLSMPVEELSPPEWEKYAELSSRKRGRRGIENAIAKGILEMAAATKLRAEAIKKRNEKFTISDCIKALDELQGINDQVYFAALDLFSNRCTARETFLTLKVEKRLMWLQTKCLAMKAS